MELLLLAPDTYHYHCPYNVSHTMPYKTLSKHLVKCPDKLPDYKNCTFNYTHVMPAAQLEAHEQNCPERILFDSVNYESEDLVRPVAVINHIPKIEYDESWDGMEQSVDVLKDISKKTILMKAKHGCSTKSERKKHRISLHEYDISNNHKQLENEEKKEQKSDLPEQKSGTVLFIGKRPDIPNY